MSNLSDQNLEGIAIIGVNGRFPGANNLEAFWQNLCAGVESITVFTDEMILQEKIDWVSKHPELLNSPNYVKAGAILEGVELFDANFFGITPREATVMDPQQRLFLECAWGALEDAGYDPTRFDGWVGVFAGVGTNYYALDHVYKNAEAVQALGRLQATLANERDYLTTRVSYKLGLTGPSVNVQTACSTSLVATHLACQSLLNYQCDMALAGGVSIRLPQVEGYAWQEGSFNSPDGHCRTFDAKAQGTLFGSGMGIVVLKRLADAVADGDHIYAVIKGSAVNNDGNDKIGFTAPGRSGQSTVIMTALAAADVDPATITYVEAHGTGTFLGDPIEVQALTRAYQASTDQTGYCAIGSVKTNIGHSDVAAGAASLIKTALALKHRLIPPSLNFESPNPQIDFENSPFYVNTRLRNWETDSLPRRAGVSSFGIGGTNAHAILEEAPELPPTSSSRPWQLLLLSAKTASALDQLTHNLAVYLKEHPDTPLADVAYTLQIGRQAFDFRRAVVCQTVPDTIETLEVGNPKRIHTATHPPQERPITFMFSGQGAQYTRMGEELYKTEPVFREHMDTCAAMLRPHLGLDLRQILYPGKDQAEAATQQLTQTGITQPALFVVEYALAQLWMSWGVQPQAMIGHSIGEYVAACLAGVFSLEDALKLVAVRGRLMQSAAPGAMMSVSLSEQGIQPYLDSDISLAAVNGASRCVVAGSMTAIEGLEVVLFHEGVPCQRLHTSHAFHSSMMEPVLERFTAYVRGVKLHPPQLPYISNVTGSWITAEQATTPSYWANHLRQTVRFSDGISLLFQETNRLFLEVGPGRTLATIARQHAPKNSNYHFFSSLRHPHDAESDVAFLAGTVGDLWLSGVEIDWKGYYEGEVRRRVSLPTYPFERQKYWLDRQGGENEKKNGRSSTSRQPLSDWFYLPSWKRTLPPVADSSILQSKQWLLFADEQGVAHQLATRLHHHGIQPILVQTGQQFTHPDDHTFTLSPQEASHYTQLLEAISAVPTAILHLGNVTHLENTPPDTASFDELLLLAQALGKQKATPDTTLTILTNNLYSTAPTDIPHSPHRALLLGPVKVIPQEYPHLHCRSIDFSLPNSFTTTFLDHLLAEAVTATPEQVVAYRGRERLVQTFELAALPEQLQQPRLRHQGVYLITGGLGGIGLVLADYLAKTCQARLVLLGRSGLPPRSAWAEWLSSHPDSDRISQQIRQVQTLETSGAEVLVLAADVTNRMQMETAVSQTLATFGSLNGVIHSAGLPGGGLIQLKTPQAATQVLAPKVQGTQILAQVLQSVSLDFLCLCSSVIGITGGVGQVDYCAANAFMDVFAETHTQQTGCFTLSINWDGWQEVGMLANTQTARTPQTTAVSAANGHLPSKTLPTTTTKPALPSSNSPGSSTTLHPFLDEMVVENENSIRFSTLLQTSKQWLLSEHHILGQSAPPGTSYLEMVRAAFTHLTGQHNVELREVIFSSPILMDESGSRTVYLQLDKEANGYLFRLLTQTSPTSWQEHARGQVGAFDPVSLPVYSVQAAIDRCPNSFEVTTALNQDGSFVYWGPRWQCLRHIYLGENETVAYLSLPEAFATDLENLALHPALLDVATAVSSQFSPGERFLPLGYEQLRFYAPLPATFYSHLARHSNRQQVLRADVTLVDEQGQVLVEIKGFALRRVDDQAASRLQTPSAQSAHPAVKASAYAAAIRPSEGAEAFHRLLARSTLCQIAVVTTDLPTRIEQATASRLSDMLAQAAGSARASTAAYARPNLHTAYLAPRTPTEQTLATIWQDLLGLNSVGVQDSFFELGGDSVLGIQVALQASKVGLEITPTQLFENPTIEQLASLLPDTATADSLQAEEEPGQLFALSPAQHHYLVHKATNKRYGFLELVIEMSQWRDPDILAEAVKQLCIFHDIFRLRFVAENGRFQPFIAAPDNIVPFSIITGAKPVDVITKLRESLSLTDGPVIQFAYLNGISEQDGRLLLVAYQWVLDAPSLQILVEDLSTIYQQLQKGQEAQLPTRSASYKQWVEQLAKETQEQKEQETAYWLAHPWQQMAQLPVGQVNGEQTEKPVYTSYPVELNTADSHFLLQETQEYNVEPTDILITALLLTLAAQTNTPYLLLEQPINGRHIANGKLTFTQTIGDFAIHAPFFLHADNSLAVKETLKQTKEQLRSQLHHGVRYALQRSLEPSTAPDNEIPTPQFVFSFTEQPISTTLGPDFHALRPQQLGLVGRVSNNQLEMEWRYQELIYQPQTIHQFTHQLLDAIQSIIAHLKADKEELLTPSDFPDAGLDQEALDKFLAKISRS